MRTGARNPLQLENRRPTMHDVLGTTDWLSDLVNAAGAAKDGVGDFTIGVEDNQFALVSPESQCVYLITVEAAQFTPASNQEGEG